MRPVDWSRSKMSCCTVIRQRAFRLCFANARIRVIYIVCFLVVAAKSDTLVRERGGGDFLKTIFFFFTTQTPRSMGLRPRLDGFARPSELFESIKKKKYDICLFAHWRRRSYFRIRTNRIGSCSTWCCLSFGLYDNYCIV